MSQVDAVGVENEKNIRSSFDCLYFFRIMSVLGFGCFQVSFLLVLVVLFAGSSDEEPKKAL